mmetsp:Transcript_9622/g.28267  ORF Transcript_9622/g.28267 Transcript_9622/m.28267 type:complete len:427 (-) Transcript_9622:407-1687(-)
MVRLCGLVLAVRAGVGLDGGRDLADERLHLVGAEGLLEGALPTKGGVHLLHGHGAHAAPVELPVIPLVHGDLPLDVAPLEVKLPVRPALDLFEELLLLRAQVLVAQAHALLGAALVRDGHVGLGLLGGRLDLLGDALGLGLLELHEPAGDHGGELLGAGHALGAQAAEVRLGVVVGLDRREGADDGAGERRLAGELAHDAHEVRAADVTALRQRGAGGGVLHAHEAGLLGGVVHGAGGHEGVGDAGGVELGGHGGHVRHGRALGHDDGAHEVLDAGGDGHISLGGEARGVGVEVDPGVHAVEVALHGGGIAGVALDEVEHVEEAGVARRARDEALLGAGAVRVEGDDLGPALRRVQNVEDELVVAGRVVQEARHEHRAAREVHRRALQERAGLRRLAAHAQNRSAARERLPRRHERAGRRHQRRHR